ncbi:MAG TPA: hypothetical protein VFC38_03025 [Stellaceae bacterium]|nr:hypothetical protein [Stellaceae bacterium]
MNKKNWLPRVAAWGALNANPKTSRRKNLLRAALLGAVAIAISGCYYAPPPYYGGGYGGGYYGAPAYYSAPAYYGPPIGVGIGFGCCGGEHHHWH